MLSGTNRITYKQATMADIDDIIDLMQTWAILEKEKVFVWPKKLCYEPIKKNIGEGKFFIARDSNSNALIAYKRIFYIDNEKELKRITQKEIRCANEEPILVDVGKFDEFGNYEQINSLPFSLLDNDICIYTGSDFTHPLYRNKGINDALMNFAFNQIKNKIAFAIDEKKAKRIVLFFGLVHTNASINLSKQKDRSFTIAHAFRSLCTSFTNKNIFLQLYRYKAYMPVWDMNATEWYHIPDDQSIPKFGCVLTCCL